MGTYEGELHRAILYATIFLSHNTTHSHHTLSQHITYSHCHHTVTHHTLSHITHCHTLSHITHCHTSHVVTHHTLSYITHCHTSHTVTDVNECHSGVCDVDTEVCHNLEGTYSCGCKEGFVRQKGKCAPKKRKSKKKGNVEEGDEDVPTIREDHRYTLFGVVGTFLLLLGAFKFVRPDLLVSLALLTLAISVVFKAATVS